MQWGSLIQSVFKKSYVTAILKAQLKELWPGTGTCLWFIRKSGWKKSSSGFSRKYWLNLAGFARAKYRYTTESRIVLTRVLSLFSILTKYAQSGSNKVLWKNPYKWKEVLCDPQRNVFASSSLWGVQQCKSTGKFHHEIISSLNPCGVTMPVSRRDGVWPILREQTLVLISIIFLSHSLSKMIMTPQSRT